MLCWPNLAYYVKKLGFIQPFQIFCFVHDLAQLITIILLWQMNTSLTLNAIMLHYLVTGTSFFLFFSFLFLYNSPFFYYVNTKIYISYTWKTWMIFSCHHDVETARINGLLGNIDANSGDPQTGIMFTFFFVDIIFFFSGGWWWRGCPWLHFSWYDNFVVAQSVGLLQVGIQMSSWLILQKLPRLCSLSLRM